MARKSSTLGGLLPLLLIPIGLCTLVLGGQQSMLKFENNGYQNLLVAISPAVNINQSEIIIKHIKLLISEASPVLFKATEHLAFFQSVHILIPPSWTHINASTSTWESFESADVIVDLPNPNHGDTPYTVQPGKCGDRGERIHFTPNYLATIDQESNVKRNGKPGKVFVHEWAHYRYGVFDEYGWMDDPIYPLFYVPNSQVPPQPNVCTDAPPDFTVVDSNDNPCDYDPVTMKYPVDCRYVFKDTFKPETSLASYHLIDSIERFCKDDQEHGHIYKAPNKHNTECDTKSTWSVIKNNEDFKSVKTFDMNKTTHVFYQIVRPDRQVGQRFVLVADVSGSMTVSNRIGKLGESVRAWISHDLPVGSKLGIVQFSATAKKVSDLQVITDERSREALMQKVPHELESATCIQCGLEMAYQMLNNDNSSNINGGVIVLVTDGQSSPGYGEINNVLPYILNATIRVVTIAFGKDADRDVEELADKTHGKSYYVDDQDTSASLQQAFQGALTYQSYVSSSDLVFMLFSNTTGNAAHRLDGSFTVDPTVGQNLTLSVYNLNDRSQVLDMKLIGPESQTFDKIEFNTRTATVVVPERAQDGAWSLVVELDPSQNSPVLVTVTTRSLPSVEYSLRTNCWVANGANIKDPSSDPIRIHAQVFKGSNPVIGAAVRAYVTKPNNTVEYVHQLYDNGANGDSTADDGIYSRYFTNATEPGRYTVKCQIEGTQSSYTELGFIGSPNPRSTAGRRKRSTEKFPTGGFNRIVSGGSFQIGKPVPIDDAYPPAQVVDLTVSLVNYSDSNVSVAMQWTAPGDELDSGLVSSYELLYADDAAELFSLNNLEDPTLLETDKRFLIKEDDLVSGSIQPVEAGSKQSATFELRNVTRKTSYYIALRSVDKAKKTSKISNVAILFVPQNPGKTSVVIIVDDPSYNDDHDVIVYHSNKMNVSSAIMTGFFLVLILFLCASLLIAIVKQSARSNAYEAVRINNSV